MNRYVTKPVNRVDAPDKACGKTKYAADYYMDNMLYVALVRSPYAHAEVVSVDTSAVTNALIYTAQDLANNIIPSILSDQPAIADQKVRFFGEIVAVVAADTPELAKLAAKQVAVNYKPLPVITDAKTAAKSTNVKIFESGNLAGQFHNTKGDPQKAFAEADLVVEDTFHVPTQEHGYIEPEASVAYVGEDQKLHLISSSQNVFYDREMICNALGLTEEQVIVKAAAIGGAFGGKDGNITQIYTALVAWKTGRPAKLVFSREENITASLKRHAAEIHVKLGLKKDGTFTAFSTELYLDTGAYGFLGPAVLGHASEHSAGPYHIENVQIDSYLCYTNRTSASAMRGFGAPQVAVANETLINRAAKALGIDPLEIRLKNALHEGDMGALGQPICNSVGLVEALENMKNSSLWQEWKQNTDKYTGYGLAASHMSFGMGKDIPDTAKVRIDKVADHYIVRVGLVDLGQGSQTVLTQMAAEALGCDIEQVTVLMSDTSETLDCGSTAASRSCYIAGNAIIEAAAKMKANHSASEEAESVFPENPMRLSVSGFPHAIYSFFVQLAKVKIDPVTAAVTIVEVASSAEAGNIINPQGFEGQVAGGIVMASGYVLSETCRNRADGTPIERDFSTYIMPTAMDAPKVSSSYVEAFEKTGPWGLKGSAEAATVALAPAVIAAVENITGAEFSTLPLNRSEIIQHIS